MDPFLKSFLSKRPSSVKMSFSPSFSNVDLLVHWQMTFIFLTRKKNGYRTKECAVLPGQSALRCQKYSRSWIFLKDRWALQVTTKGFAISQFSVSLYFDSKSSKIGLKNQKIDKTGRGYYVADECSILFTVAFDRLKDYPSHSMGCVRWVEFERSKDCQMQCSVIKSNE